MFLCISWRKLLQIFVILFKGFNAEICLVVHKAFREQIMRLHFENRCKIKCAVVAKQERVNLIKCLSLVHLFFSFYIIPSFLKSRFFEHSEEKQHTLREIWFLASKISNTRSNPHSLIFHFWSRTEEDSPLLNFWPTLNKF